MKKASSSSVKGFLLYRIYYSAPDGDYLVYVGRTKQSLSSRLRGHFFQKPMHRTIDISGVSKIEYTSFDTEADMNLYEIYYILTLHPPLNVDDKTRDYPTVTLPEVEWHEFWPPLMEKWRAELEEQSRVYQSKRTQYNRLQEDIGVLRSRYRTGEIEESEYWERRDNLEQERKRLHLELYPKRR